MDMICEKYKSYLQYRILHHQNRLDINQKKKYKMENDM